MTVARRSPFRIRAPLWAVLLTGMGIAIGTSAGLWQLDRAAQKRELHARFAAGTSAAAHDGLVADGVDRESRYARLRLYGTYDSAHQILLDNMSHDGVPGYQVLTPFETAAGTVLVNRGWIPSDGNRQVLPDLGVGTAARQVSGRIDQLPRPAIELEVPLPPADAPWPRRLHFPTMPAIADQLGVPLPGYQLLLDAGEPDGFLRDWQPGGMKPERHVAYAVQWFGLALTAGIIFLVLAIRNGRNAS